MEEKITNNYFHETSFVDETGHSKTIKIPVVQELARQGLRNIPQNFLQNPNEFPTTSSSQSPIPIINMVNLAPESDPSVRTKELTRLAKSAKEWGLFQLVNHGVCLRSLQRVVKEFFDLSFEEKKASVGTYRSVDNMGYGRNYVKSNDQPLDWIDRITMRAAPKGDTDGIHVWPRKPHDFRQVMEDYVEEGRRILDELLEALAESLGLDKHSFSQFFEPAQSVANIRVNYYPPCPRPSQVLGISPHSDPSTLTLLAQFESSGGLEVFKDMEWIKITWPCDTLVVNVGDLFEIMSNGQVQSPWHRAVTQEDKERFSVALFYNPPMQTEIEPVKDPSSDGPGYKKVVLKDYLENYYKVYPTTNKQLALLFAKE